MSVPDRAQTTAPLPPTETMSMTSHRTPLSCPWWLLLAFALFSSTGCAFVADDAVGAADPALGPFDPGDPPELYCASLCGDGECIPLSGESCSTCLEDCGQPDTCVEFRHSFGSGSTSLDLGEDLILGCASNASAYTIRHRPDRGVVEGAEPLPFKEGGERFLTQPPGCGGVADGGPVDGDGVSVRDGTFGFNTPCLTVGGNAAGVPVEVGLRYETGRWRVPDPSLPQDALRPGSANVGANWFVSYSRRLHGDFPAPSIAEWAPTELPASFTLYLEDYTEYRFERVDGSRDYVQPGATLQTAVASARLATLDDSNLSCAGNFGDQLIAPNDVLVQFPDGSLDVFSSRNLTFKGHIDNDGNQLVVSHRLETFEGAEPLCSGAPIEEQPVGVKRIASIPAGRTEPLYWIDLRHAPTYRLRPGADPAASPGIYIESWRLDQVRDSTGRVVQLVYGPSAVDAPTELNADELIRVEYAPGRPEQQIYAVAYDATRTVNALLRPTPLADQAGMAYNQVDLTYAHPADPSVGGLSRVLTQTRPIGGELQTTTFAWGDELPDLTVTYPDGLTRRYAHETPQGSTAAGLAPAGADEDRVTAVYNLGAAENPARIAYDPVSKFVVQQCDPLGDPTTGARCVTRRYDANLNLEEVETRSEDGTPAITRYTYESFVPANNWRISSRVGPTGDETSFYYETGQLLGGALWSARIDRSVDGLGETRFEYCDGPIGLTGTTCPIGKLESMVSPQGAETRYEYDPWLGTPARTILTNGAETRSTYDARGCLLSSVDVHGVETELVYDDPAPGALLGVQHDCLPVAQIRNPDGEGTERVETRFGYGPAREPFRVVEDFGGESDNANSTHETPQRVVSYGGAFGDVVVARGGDGDGFISVVEYGYDVYGRTTSVRDVSMFGREITAEYAHQPDGSSSVFEARSGIDALRVTVRDAAGDVVEHIDERGVTQRFVFSPQSGRLVETIEGAEDVGGSSAAEMITEHSYTLDGLIEEIVHPDGEIESFEYDDERRLVEHRTVQGEDEIRRVQVFDDHDRVVRLEQYTGGAEEPDQIAERLFEGDAGEGPRVVEERVRSLLDPSQDARTTYGYAADWDTCSFGETDGSGGRVPGTDERGGCWAPRRVTRPSEVQASEPANRTMSYDGLGRLASVTARGVGAAGEDVTWTYAYDGLGCMRRTEGGGRTQRFLCDRLARTQVELEGPTGVAGRSILRYADGSIQEVVDFDGTTTSYDLDETGWRLGGIRYESTTPGTLPVGDVSFEYLDNDLLWRMTDGTGETTYAYDAANRIRARTRQQGTDAPRTITYGRDAGSRRLRSREYWGRGQVVYGHDPEGRVTEESIFGEATQRYSYRADGLLEVIESPGVGAIFGYGDETGRPQLGNMIWTEGSLPGLGERVFERFYDIDPSGNVDGYLTGWGDGAEACAAQSSFQQDAQDRLTIVQQPALGCPGFPVPEASYRIAYDARGNVLAHDYEAPSSPVSFDSYADRFFAPTPADRVDSVSFLSADTPLFDVPVTEEVQYDARGNLTCYPETEGGCDTPTYTCTLREEVEASPRPALADPCPIDPTGVIDNDAIEAQLDALFASPPPYLTSAQSFGPIENGTCGGMVAVRLPVSCEEESFDYRMSFLGGALTVGGAGVGSVLPDWVVTSRYTVDGSPEMDFCPPQGCTIMASPGGVNDPAVACGVGTSWSETTETPRDPIDVSGSTDYLRLHRAYCAGSSDPGGPCEGTGLGADPGFEASGSPIEGCYGIVRLGGFGQVNAGCFTTGSPAGGLLAYGFEALDCLDAPPETGSAIRFAYDAANRLRRIESDGQTVELEYDGLGNLAAQRITEGGVTRNLGIIVDELYAHPKVVGVYDRTVANDPGDAFVYGPAGLAAVVDPAGTLSWAVTDRLESVMALVDETGELVGRREYDARGLIRRTQGVMPAVGFTGEYQTSKDTVWLRARHYHAGLGRFLQRDTWAGNPANPQTLNRYAYAQNNPLSYVDPSGFAAFHRESFGFHAEVASWGSGMAGGNGPVGAGEAAYGFAIGATSAVGMSAAGGLLGTALVTACAGSGVCLAGLAVAGAGMAVYGALQTWQQRDRIGRALNGQGTFEDWMFVGGLSADVAMGVGGVIRGRGPRGPRVGGCNCFEGDTLVATDEGRLPIRDVVQRMERVFEAQEAVLAAEERLAAAEERGEPEAIREAWEALDAAQERLDAAPEPLRALSVPEDDVHAEPRFQDITHVFERSPRELVELVLENEAGEVQTLQVTPGHPFWLEGVGWVAAEDLLDEDPKPSAEVGR